MVRAIDPIHEVLGAHNEGDLIDELCSGSSLECVPLERDPPSPFSLTPSWMRRKSPSIGPLDSHLIETKQQECRYNE